MHIMDYLSALHTRRPSLESLEPRIRAWAERVGLWGNTTVGKQYKKFSEEWGEFQQARKAGDSDAIAMEAGDVLFTLSMMAQSCGLTMAECIEDPKKVIKARSTMFWAFARYPMLSENIRIELAMSPAECLALAVNKVEKRTGNVVDGFFVKDAD